MKCSQCGFENEPGNLFCEQCGIKLSNKKESQFDGPTLVNENVNTSPSEVKCPNCQASNVLDATFCTSCGTPLHNSSSNLINSSPQSFEQLSSFNFQPSLAEQDSSRESSASKKKWIIIGSSILLVALLIGAGAFWWIYSTGNSNKDKSEEQHLVMKSDEEKKDENKIVVARPQENSSQNVFLKEDSQESKTSKVQEESSQEKIKIAETPSSSNEVIQLDVTPESSIALNYSGASCAVMALDLQGVNASQSSIGNQLGLNEGKISDYRDLTQVINGSLSRNGSNTLYSNFYLVTDDLTSQEKMDMYTLLLSRVDQSLQDGKATLVVIGSSPDGKLQRNFYGLIYGKTTEDDEDTYSIIIPYVDGAKSYDVDPQTLANMVSIPEAFCYIY